MPALDILLERLISEQQRRALGRQAAAAALNPEPETQFRPPTDVLSTLAGAAMTPSAPRLPSLEAQAMQLRNAAPRVAAGISAEARAQAPPDPTQRDVLRDLLSLPESEMVTESLKMMMGVPAGGGIPAFVGAVSRPTMRASQVSRLKERLLPDPASFLRPGDPDLRVDAIRQRLKERGLSGKEEVAEAINRDSIEQLRLAGVEFNPADELERVGRLNAADTVHALMQPGNSADWYRLKIEEMHQLVGLEFPEILKDDTAKSTFDYILAVTSNGQDVPLNSSFALNVYETFRRTGRMPDVGWGDRKAIMREHFALWNTGVDFFGSPDEFVKFLHTDFTPAQLRALGFIVTPAAGRDTLKGSDILGPKIGGGFFQNLEGNYDRFTLDLWMRRGLGAQTGTVMADNPELVAKRMDRFLESIRKPQARAAIESIMGEPFPPLPNDPSALSDLANKIFKKWGQAGHPLERIEGSIPDEAFRSSRELVKLTREPVAAPSDPERAFQTNTIDFGVDLLRKAGIDITPADMQALLWGEQQGLWKDLGSRIRPTTNFSAEMSKLLEARGYGKRKIENAIARAAGERGGVGQDPLRTQGGDLPASREGLSGSAQRGLVEQLVSQRLRVLEGVGEGAGGGGRSVARANGGGSRFTLSDGSTVRVPVEARFSITTAAQNTLRQFGISAPKMLSLTPGESAGRVFHDKISAAVASNPSAGKAVDIYSPEEYAGLTTFLTEDGTAGFALQGDDIVSVFRHSSSPHKGAALGMVQVAISRGGRTLNGFQVPLKSSSPGPHLAQLYARNGLVPVAKVKFDPEMAPPDWDYARMDEPDLVFMVYDPARSSGRYIEPRRYMSYDRAVKTQQAEKRKLATESQSFENRVQAARNVFETQGGGHPRPRRSGVTERLTAP